MMKPAYMYGKSLVYLQGKDTWLPLSQIIKRVVTKVSVDPQMIQYFTTTFHFLGKKGSLLSLRLMRTGSGVGD